MTQTMIDDAELKARHRAMWALGDYPTVANDLVTELGAVLVAATEVAPGDRLLDVAAGPGNVAIPAARAGARVTASDLTPELLAAGRRQADAEGLDISWEQGDAESLPYAADQFDVTTSSLGVMFAPHHQAAADELIRVTRPGGRIGLACWTPSGFIGQMLAAMKPYAPPPPPGASPAPLWGDPDHVRELFGDRVRDLQFDTRQLRITHFATAAEFRDYFKNNYGPTIVAYRALDGQPDRITALDRALEELGRRSDLHVGDRLTMDWEYLLVSARVN